MLLPSHSHTSIEMNAINPLNTFKVPQIGIYDARVYQFVLDRLVELVREADKQQIHKALIVQQMIGMNSQLTPLQLTKDSQQFAGDGHEVKQIATTYGNHPEPSMIDRLLSTTATRH